MAYATVAERWRPAGAWAALGYDAAVVAAGSALMALSAQVEVPLWPVPVTGQTFAVLLVGALLGPLRGAAAVGMYLLEGAAGLGVFAGGGAGAAHLVGPTGGYLAGFVPAAALTGWLARRGWDRRWWSAAGAMGLGTLVIYLAGAAWLAGFVGAERAVTAGVLPFLVGDALKVVVAAAVLPAGWRVLGWLGPRGGGGPVSG